MSNWSILNQSAITDNTEPQTVISRDPMQQINIVVSPQGESDVNWEPIYGNGDGP